MRFLYWTTAFLSAGLLFLIQPILAKSLLPFFGGSAGVWTAALFFFQGLLLAGYLWSHAVTRLPPVLGRSGQVALLLCSLLFLPVHPIVVPQGAPLWSVLLTLARTVGLPCLALCSTSPLIQTWYAGRFATSIPWRVFALSNLASLAGLLCYPLVLEPLLGNAAQLQYWSWAFAAYALLCMACAAAGPYRSTVETEEPLPKCAVAVWIALAFAPSALWMATATYISQTVTPLPLIWIVFLTVYLLSFMLCFSPFTPYRRTAMAWLLPVGIVLIVGAMQWNRVAATLPPLVLLFAAGLFLCCLFCHGELYERRPSQAQLTSFYLAVAFGGALGAAFVSILAPLAFPTFLELPFSVGCTALLGMGLLYHYPPRRLLRTGLLVGAALFVANAFEERSLYAARNFYGSLQVREIQEDSQKARSLYNGSTMHGFQFETAGRQQEPTAYYSRSSGVGLLLSSMNDDHRRIGVIGLGTGTLAAYGRAGDVIRFYELNPMVIDVAQKAFTFLRESPAHVEVIEGDARLQLAREPAQNYNLLVLDAFSGDAIPVHLLSTEAFALYRSHLAPGGAIAVHVTNRYLNLVPLVVRTAGAGGWKAQTITSPADAARGSSSAVWVIVKGQRSAVPSKGVWTDDRSDLISVLQ